MKKLVEIIGAAYILCGAITAVAAVSGYIDIVDGEVIGKRPVKADK